MSRQTITDFYSAFARLDGAAMQACYAERATFRDEAFELSGRERIGGMWRMLTDTTRAKAPADWKLAFSEVTDASAHWEAHYRFTATGRLVHNVIEARFTFDGDGRIATHVDSFDFWRWARQALGPPGLLLGWTPWLRAKVRAQAGANLEQFLAAKT
jgi:hypothetical protein